MTKTGILPNGSSINTKLVSSFKRPHIESEEKKVEEETREQKLSKNGKKTCILHIDDESVQLELAKDFLEQENPKFRVYSSLSPKKAMLMLQDQEFDCIVVDYNMPGINGIEFAKKIKDDYDVPVIIYTGKGSDEVADETFTAGIDDYVRKELKPSHYKVLAKRIQSAVEMKRFESTLKKSKEDLKRVQNKSSIEIKNREKALKESEAKYQYLFEEFNDGLVTINPDGRIINCNSVFCRLTGREKDKILSMKIWDIRPIEKRDAAKKKFFEIKKKGFGGSTKLEFEKPNGELVNINFSSREIRFEQKKVFLSRCRIILKM